MKTLVVHYTPREERSNTKEILDAFLKHIPDAEILDLVKDPPDIFGYESIAAYMKMHYAGEKLSPQEAKTLAKIHRMADQLIIADYLVLAFPTYNFSVPAAVKAWLDSVILNNKTFRMTDLGFEGMLKGKKALIINTRGGVYTNNDWSKNEHAVSLAQADLEFMGFSVEIAVAEGINMMPQKTQEIITAAQNKVIAVAKRWYK